ncbi:SEL1-like repeat protein [Amphritea pacifica]|uniref:SEL1-like repeat protein n=2 Tax=Amphritea pacifica TaxID=2811233 RepID=A0ABS2WEE3_9GAMM|nr:SEL1-like repeat protein [Amphritea pacifica]MBN0989877.1 SEL1-like repeat protein [Amphritea pacifica]
MLKFRYLLYVFILFALSPSVFSANDLSISDEAYDALSSQKWENAREKIIQLDKDDPITNLYWGIYYGNRNNPFSDDKLATTYLEKAAIDNLLHARLLLAGRLLFNDNPLVTDYSRGIFWAKTILPTLESNPNNSEYAKNLAMFYLLGIGVEKDIEKAVCLFERAASKGDLFSRNKLEQLKSYDVNGCKQLK